MELGSISAQFESNHDVAAISDNPNDPGGKSYGTYQLSKVMLFDYIKQTPFTLKGMISTDAFDSYWRKVACEYPIEFALDQRLFITKKLYLPNAIYAKDLGYDTDSRKIQEAIFSIAVQHGGVKTILKDGFVSSDDVHEVLGSLYHTRLHYVLSLGLSESLKTALKNRYIWELKALFDLQEEFYGFYQ